MAPRLLCESWVLADTFEPSQSHLENEVPTRGTVRAIFVCPVCILMQSFPKPGPAHSRHSSFLPCSHRIRYFVNTTVLVASGSWK